MEDNKWKCPIEDLDEDIKEIIKILHENNIKPYMSCSGSYRDHKRKPYFPESADIEILDSNLARELIAVLIKDKRFKCTISKEKGREIYDNKLPNGLRLKIEFENICGDVGKELLSIIKSIIHGRKAETESREKVDIVCSLIDSFDITNGNTISFSFNDEMIEPNKENEDNYSIEIIDSRNFSQLEEGIYRAIDGLMQDENKCKLYGKDFLTILSVLKRIKENYNKISRLKKGQKLPKIHSGQKRINKFRNNLKEKMERARQEDDKSLNFSTALIDLESLLGTSGEGRGD